MKRRFELRPLDGAVVGFVIGALIFAIVTAGETTPQLRLSTTAARSTSTSAASTTVARLNPSTTATRLQPSTTNASATSITSAPTTVTTAANTAVTRPPTTTPSRNSSADALINQLTVASEGNGVGYDRALFLHWIDADHDGCDTRCEVLEAERRYDLPGLPNGGWLSIYDGYTTDEPGEFDVDHVVALGEAWRSGADTWDAERRRAFANDLDYPDALIAVTAATNRSKRDRDPASWQPPNRGAWCQFGFAWVKVKIKWSLTADKAEIGALHNMLSTC